LNPFRPTLFWLQLSHVFFWARLVSYRSGLCVFEDLKSAKQIGHTIPQMCS
jgi:hypothetical protein